MGTRHERPIAEYLAGVQRGFAASGDFSALPTSQQVADLLGLSLAIVQRTAAWREFAAWTRTLSPVCAVCGQRTGTKVIRMCHTHRERWRRWGSPEPWQEWAEACREDRLNTCEGCGKQFNGAQGRISLCHDCDQVRRRKRALDRWYAMSPEDRQVENERRKQRGRRETRKRRQRIQVVVCTICGREFRGFPHRKFCGTRCRQESANRQRREIRRRVKLLQLLQEQNTLKEMLRDARGQESTDRDANRD